MRRFSSMFISAAVAISGLTLTANGASADSSGKATIKNVAVVAPSAVPNAQIIRLQRLNQTNAFLVAGIDTVTAGANIHIWKMKDDLTIDSSFATVNLGDDFEYPTSSNSSCMSQQSNSHCYSVDNLSVNETSGYFAIVFRREMTVGSGMNQKSATLSSIAVGNLKTGAITAKKVFVLNDSPFYDPTTDFAAYNVTPLSSSLCTSNFGATFQSIALNTGYASGYSVALRPDGSLMMGLTCMYSLFANSSRTEYETRGLFVIKPSGNSLALDTTWGTNGFVKIFDDHTRCAQIWDSSSADTSITSLSSTKVHTVTNIMYYPRSTQHPYDNNITNYNGCQSNQYSYTSSALIARKIDGSPLATNTFATAIAPSGRWLIDTAGRWNNLISTLSGNTPSYSLFRLTTKGEPDTTLGTDGKKTMTNMPTTVTVNGASVPMRYSLLGIAATATGFMFTGFSEAGRPMSVMCNQPSTYESANYPYYLSTDSGLVDSYGTNGLGEKMTYTDLASCGSSSGARVTFINAKGQPALLTVLRALGSQSAGIRYTVWEAAAGVTAGGDGTGTVGGASAGRVDTKVYSTKLPKAVQADSALTVLTAKQAKDLDIRSNTPKICVALTTSVVMVNPGRCSVRIIDEDTKKVIRTMSTIVKKSEVQEGTVLTTDEPIMFKQAGVTLSKTARAQVAELATAASSAARVVVIGHSASLGEVSEYSYAISRERANAVKAALVKAGVKTTIEVVAMAYTQPEKTAKTEAAQAKNRRVEVYIFPK